MSASTFTPYLRAMIVGVSPALMVWEREPELPAALAARILGWLLGLDGGELTSVREGDSAGCEIRTGVGSGAGAGPG